MAPGPLVILATSQRTLSRTSRSSSKPVTVLPTCNNMTSIKITLTFTIISTLCKLSKYSYHHYPGDQSPVSHEVVVVVVEWTYTRGLWRPLHTPPELHICLQGQQGIWPQATRVPPFGISCLQQQEKREAQVKILHHIYRTPQLSAALQQ
ncbi:hypothetical protein E2C01_018151 [Portunus trituberculatus]|uniref:Uncharacterized protein n=1 Tax=Portunus trituberculatus TaxID=210409 RepID=A0A5B7DVM3_PORTR|nr:hypothetical protein [Portunus trituberculatus]